MSSENDKLLEKVVKMLFEKAREDGILSPEEAAIIERVKLDVDNYKKALKQAEKDGIITLNESMKLEELKNKILAKASDVAVEDLHLDDDEKALLQQLADILNHYV